MKYKLALVMSVLCAFSAWTEAKVKLPAILSDGMAVSYTHLTLPTILLV